MREQNKAPYTKETQKALHFFTLGSEPETENMTETEKERERERELKTLNQKDFRERIPLAPKLVRFLGNR